MSLNLPARRMKMRIDPAYSIVNIVLLLIFFFLLAGQKTPFTSDLRLAETTQLPAGNMPSPVLEILSEDQWRLDGQPLRPELLATALPDEEVPIHLVIDREARSALLLAILRRPELADRPIRLVTQHGGATQ